MSENQDDLVELTYEQKVEKLDEILSRLDNSETPIDKLADDIKMGATEKGDCFVYLFLSIIFASIRICPQPPHLSPTSSQ